MDRRQFLITSTALVASTAIGSAPVAAAVKPAVKDIIYLDTNLAGALGLNVVPLGDSPPDFTWRMYYSTQSLADPYEPLDNWALETAKEYIGLDSDAPDDHPELLAHLDELHPQNGKPEFHAQQEYYLRNCSMSDAYDYFRMAFDQLEEEQQARFEELGLLYYDDMYDARSVQWASGNAEVLQEMFDAAGMDVEVCVA